jgi:hypothetical protein
MPWAYGQVCWNVAALMANERRGTGYKMAFINMELE